MIGNLHRFAVRPLRRFQVPLIIPNQQAVLRDVEVVVTLCLIQQPWLGLPAIASKTTSLTSCS